MKIDSKTPQDSWFLGDSRQQVMKVYSRLKVMKTDTASNESYSQQKIDSKIVFKNGYYCYS